jgi:hypothetical protein
VNQEGEVPVVNELDQELDGWDVEAGYFRPADVSKSNI